MTIYRVSLLDNDGVIAETRVASNLTETAELLVLLGECTGEDWAKPLLDEYGEFTAEVTGAGGRPLEPSENTRLFALVREHGGVTPVDGAELGRLRWHNPERQT